MKLALCVRIKRRDGKILRTTSHDKDIPVTASGYEGTYRSAAALAPSEMQFRATLAVDGLDITGVLAQATGIPENLVAAGVYDMARVTVFEVDWSDPSEVRELVYGVLGNKRRTEEGRLQMEIRTLAQLLNQDQGDVYLRRCRAELGSGSEATVLRRCGVDMAAYTFDDQVSSPVSRAAFVVGTLTQDAGYFSKGTVEFLSGENTGAVREIRIHEAGGVLLLYDPLPFDVTAGDDVRVKAGCDKTIATCNSKFLNAVNFRGEPDIPGEGFMARSSGQPPQSKPGGQSIFGAALQIAGAIIGSYFGPLGAYIGSMVALAIAPVSGGRSVGPKADDLRVTTSTSGNRIPYVAGQFFVDGNIVWAKEISEVSRTKRVGKSLFSSGTKVTTFTYFGTFAVSLCEGPITSITRIWAYEKLIYDARPLEVREAEFLARSLQFNFLGIEFSQVADLNADLEAVMTIYTGTDDQGPDPTIANEGGSSDDDVPAFRGQAYVVFNELPLDQFGYGARIPQLRFEICRPLPEIPAPGASDDNDGDDVLVTA